jgi:hypothetical protein
MLRYLRGCYIPAEHSRSGIKARFAPLVNPTIPYSKSDRQELFDLWRDIVMRYMGKSLTKEQDRLPPLSGIAKRAQKVLNSRYVAGLWADDMTGRLYWAVDQGLASSPGPGFVRLTSFRAPSGS